MYNLFRDNLGIEPKGRSRTYQKPYPSYLDSTPYPPNFRIPEFVKFSGDDNKTTWEHISQYIAQLGDNSGNDALKVRLFSLSLTGTAFSWFTSLPANSIYTWTQLEEKFHDHFYSGEIEMNLSHLATLKQIANYIKRFRDVKNRCFNLNISEKDLAQLAFVNLLSHIKEKLQGQEFFSLSQLQQKASAHESRSKDHVKTSRPNMHVLDEYSDSDDEEGDMYVAEFYWPFKSKPSSCASLRPISKNRQNEMKFTFDVAKCDRIFDDLAKKRQHQDGSYNTTGGKVEA